jgi:hypothetical protein
MPEKFVQKHIHLKPQACTCGSTNLEETDQEPLRHQVVDIPPIEPQVTEYVQHVRVQQAAHADETGWPRGNRQKGWLWTLCCSTAAFFMVHAHRGQDAAQKLLGTFAGILHCDRWSGYNCFSGLRQLCWAHLKRDFSGIERM